jgi:hypothetical protein
MSEIISSLSREDLLREFPKGSIGAELGVFTWEFSEYILSTVKPQKFYLVDSWKGQCISTDKHGIVRRRFLPLTYWLLRKKYKNNPNISFARTISTKFLTEIKIGSLDWVYIDTIHDYSNTLSKLFLSWVAVKSGGIISGHDSDCKEVKLALDVFCETMKVDYKIWTGNKYHSFSLIKNK